MAWFIARRVLEGNTHAGMKMEVYTRLEPPHQIMWASDDWLNFCGFNRTEVSGQTLRVLQGPETSMDVIAAIMDAVRRKETIQATLLNYTKHAVPFYHTISIEPLVNADGQPALYKVASSDVMSSRDVVAWQQVAAGGLPDQWQLAATYGAGMLPAVGFPATSQPAAEAEQIA